MCEKIKASNNSISERLGDRPLRWETANKLAIKLMRSVVKVERQFNAELIRVMNQIKPPHVKVFDIDSLFFNIHYDDYDIESHQDWIETIIEKQKQDYTQIIQGLRSRMLALGMTYENIQLLEELFLKFGEQFAAAFKELYPEIYQDGLNEAYNYIERYAKIQSPTLFAAVRSVYPLNTNSTLYTEFSSSGQQRIVSKLTKQFQSLTMKVISEGLERGLSWSDITENVAQKVGKGAKWHWNRLVRTEIQIAYNSAFNERYADAGIQYVTLSVTRSACEICVGDKGTYIFGQQPQIPIHPHCRCTYIPHFNLPDGVILRGRELSQGNNPTPINLPASNTNILPE
jgi:SPP1 gp7 family putative phage head morphogenesis protein